MKDSNLYKKSNPLSFLAYPIWIYILYLRACKSLTRRQKDFK